MRTLLLYLLCTAELLAQSVNYSLQVRNGAAAREDLVMAQKITAAWVTQAASHTLYERLEDGTLKPVPCVVDSSGAQPELVWLLTGVSVPNALRQYLWQAGGGAAEVAGDLRVCIDAAEITVENQHFRLSHPVRGRGGLPHNIEYKVSGRQDASLFFYDRIVRKGTDGRVWQYAVKDCAEASTRVVLATPLRVVVETVTGFGKEGDTPPGQPQVIYRYVYTAFSPVVEVTARYWRQDSEPWQEQHFLHLSRQECGYDRFVTGENGLISAMQPKGQKSKGISDSFWGVMESAQEACGVASDGVVCWDASSEFVYYVRTAGRGWESGATTLAGLLYFGARLQAAEYDLWLNERCRPEITVYRDGATWLPLEQSELTGAHELANSALRLVFAAAAEGFDSLGIENLLVERTPFVKARAGQAGLWSLTFTTAPDASGKQESVVVNNHVAAGRVYAKKSSRKIQFFWQGIDLPCEPAVLDVVAEVSLAQGAGASEWRIKAHNRSRRFSLESTSYPELCAVVPHGVGDVLLPTGNWGGLLMRQHKGSYNASYPSASCPLQMMAFNLGAAGLYVGVHDGEARSKSLVLTREQDLHVKLMAENSGVPGACGTPPYSVVIAAYKGDWWQAARLYRTWATRQVWCAPGPIAKRADYPERLKELGFWMLLGDKPEVNLKDMQSAALLFPAVPIGVHWYNWHQIPFDHTYPEYFPVKPGMQEATAAMVGAGQTVMPYINARLWDSEIASFATAFPYASKQVTGTNYVETYGSGRKLAPMCVATPFWQHKVQEICQRLMDECGVNAIYLDQIGAAKPAPCHDATHGHPLMGGKHWVDGYRAMLAPIKREAARRNVVLTTENTAEPYMDNIDAFLVWNQRQEEDVPLLPAVYSGYTTYFSSPQAVNDTLDAFCAAQGRDFLWGCQLGWNGSWILSEAQRDKQRFQYELCRYRVAAKEFMVEGQLLDEIRPLHNLPLMMHCWHRTTPHNARLPVVMATLWRDPQGRLAVFMVNTGATPQRFAFELVPERWGVKRSDKTHFSLLTPQGTTLLDQAGQERLLLGDLQPREIRVLVYNTRF